jgi:hypothetical protein
LGAANNTAAHATTSTAATIAVCRRIVRRAMCLSTPFL